VLSRPWLRNTTNALLAPFGLRVASTRWGPRGQMDTLRRIRAQGVVLKQIVDAGAFDGSWTRECMRVFPEARYLLVDPLPANEAALRSLQAEHPNTRFWLGALGSGPDTRELFEHKDQSSFLASDRYDTTSSRPVQLRALDSFLDSADLDAPDLIKADVQGYELEVLRGAEKSLKSTQLLLLEVSFRRLYRDLPLAHEVIAFVGSQGFRIYDICSYVGRPSDGELQQADILFARESSPLFENDARW
jgi:FkbM family methyltransferase